MKKVAVIPFSSKSGLLEDASGNGGGFVFDYRAMANPFWGVMPYWKVKQESAS